MTAIYKIQSKTHPERFYIGSSVNINERWQEHLRLLRKGKHHSKFMQNHYNKYGKQDLVFTEVMKGDTELLLREEFVIYVTRPCWNTHIIPSKTNLGLKVSNETRTKMSAAHKRNNIWLGHKHTAESKAKMSAVWRAKKNEK